MMDNIDATMKKLTTYRQALASNLQRLEAACSVVPTKQQEKIDSGVSGEKEDKEAAAAAAATRIRFDDSALLTSNSLWRHASSSQDPDAQLVVPLPLNMEEELHEQEEEITTLSQLVIELGSDSDDDDSVASSSSSSSQRVAQWIKEAPANFLIEFPDTREQLEFLTRQTDSASVERCVAQLQVIPLTPENVQKETCRAYMLQILKISLLAIKRSGIASPQWQSL